MSDFSVKVYDGELAIYDYRLLGFTVNEVVSRVKNFVENKLPKMLESSPEVVFNKVIKIHNLRKEFSSFVEERGIIKEKLYITFIKECISESLRNVIRWAKIFKTEKEDRTNRKHRKHIKEMLPYLNEITKICIFFTQDEKKTFAKISSNILKKDISNNFNKRAIFQ